MPGKDIKAKVLCIPYTHTLSHISRPLLVAKELERRGHDIHFAGGGSKTTFIRQEGFIVHPLYEPDPDLLFGNIRQGKLRFVPDHEIEQMIEADLQLYQEVKPDIVITDGRFSAPISTHIAGLKHAAIVNVSSTEYRALPYIPFFDWLPTWLVPKNSNLKENLDKINLSLEMLVFNNAMSIFSRLSKTYKVKPHVTATNCLTGKDLTLLADIPEYFPTRKLPANYHYIGPLTWKSPMQNPSWWPLEKGEKPIVYVTMGTTGISDFFSKIFDIFKSSDITIIMSTGGQANNVASMEGKLYCEDYLDGDLIMGICDLVVCHGGNGTIYQALQHGKPVIGIPTIPDQMFNMRRVEALGFGRMLRWKDFLDNPVALQQLTREMIANCGYMQKAQKLQQRVCAYDAAIISADLLEALFNEST